MATVHITLQKKGGVGKSMVSSMWMQALRENGFPVVGIDTDPSNKSFAEFSELGVTKLELIDENKEIDPRRFDALVETISMLPEDHHIVIDVGASCFVALFAYLEANGPFDLLKANGHQIFIHTPLMGGPDLIFTTASLETLVTTFPEEKFILWKNRYHGDLVIDNVPFEQFTIYPQIKGSLVAEIEIPHKNQKTFVKDVELVMAKKQLFRTAINSAVLPMMVRQRVGIFWNEMGEAIKPALALFDQPQGKPQKSPKPPKASAETMEAAPAE